MVGTRLYGRLNFVEWRHAELPPLRSCAIKHLFLVPDLMQTYRHDELSLQTYSELRT